jgi:transcriptional regulator with XRE-family HTH domain
VLDVKNLGPRLRAIRKETKLNSHLFSKRMHTSSAQLSRVENGSREVSISWLERFAEEGYGVSVRELLSRLESPTDNLIEDPFVVEIAPLVKFLSPRSREIILEVLRDLKERFV